MILLIFLFNLRNGGTNTHVILFEQFSWGLISEFDKEDIVRKTTGIFFFFTILMIAALACNLPSESSVAADDKNVTQFPVAPTHSDAQDQNATATQPEAPATDTPTPSLTPSITPTHTPSVPMVSVSANTNCRKGPGIVYDNLTALLVGEEAEVVGKYTPTDPDYWIIKKDSVTCWLWGEYATVDGDTANLPEMIPPPTPTPSPTPTPTATATPTSSPTP